MSHEKGLFFYKKPTVCKRMNRYGQTSLVVVQVLCSSRMESPTLEEALIAFRKGIKYKVIEKYIDTEGRYIVLNLLLNNSPVVLMNYYAPNQEAEQLKVLDRLTHILDQLDMAQDTIFIWSGDFNMTFDIDLDADGGSPKLYIKSVSKLLSVMSEIGPCDIYRVDQKP